MSVKDHPDYPEETSRLKQTVDCVNKTIEKNIEQKNIIREDIVEEFKNLDRTDSAQSYQRVALSEAMYEMTAAQYRALIKASKKPYFSRIDFKRHDSDEIKKFYIGKLALVGGDIENPLIVDWRAPLSSVYYDGRLGEVTYDAPGGPQRGELYLKRQYTISDAELEGIVDVDITASDAFLQAVLGGNKEKRLQDIVSTIQAEQNKIIRADIYSPLIVQGAAGSGKTTVALHRIAYLIYTFQKDFRPGDFLIIAPNRLFLNYISEVLPELGAENVRQTTFADLMFELLGSRLKMNDPDEKLVRLISADPESEEIRRICAFKSSLAFRDLIDRWAEYVSDRFIPESDFMLGVHTVLPASEIKRIFTGSMSRMPVYERIPVLKKMLRDKLKEQTAALTQMTDAGYEAQIEQIRKTVPPEGGRREKLTALFDERDEKIAVHKNASKTAAAKYLALLEKKDCVSYYRELVADPEKIMAFAQTDSEFAARFCAHQTALLKKGTVEIEDLAALCYLKHKLFGSEKSEIRCIVVDEAQDLSVFQLYVLKEIFKTELFTLLGDTAQGIHSYRGMTGWNEAALLFPDGRCRILTLEQSYRTTVEIMNAANAVLGLSGMDGIVPAKPVLRHGAEPGLYRFFNTLTMIKELAAKIGGLLAEGYKTVAVVCKTVSECQKVKKLLADLGLEIRLLSSDDAVYEGGTVIVPTYQTKGLEFDAVVICSLTEDYLLRELDIKLLYVAMTRAVHRLDILCPDNKLSLLDGLDGIGRH